MPCANCVDVRGGVGDEGRVPGPNGSYGGVFLGTAEKRCPEMLEQDEAPPQVQLNANTIHATPLPGLVEELVGVLLHFNAYRFTR